jgi:Icc-related predicted phosphoesterase
MKITLISDTHGLHRKVKLTGGDILIHCGDVSNKGKEIELQEFYDWFKNQAYTHKVFIAGNHDFGLQDNKIESFDLPEGIIYLEDSSVEVDGVKIYGSPYTPNFCDWAFMKERGKEMRDIWAKIEKCDILITHGPLHGIFDTVERIYGNEHVGCEELAKKVFEINPKIHAFGHIHGGYGNEFFHNTRFINCSVLNDYYEYANKPVDIDYLNPA